MGVGGLDDQLKKFCLLTSPPLMPARKRDSSQRTMGVGSTISPSAEEFYSLELPTPTTPHAGEETGLRPKDDGGRVDDLAIS